MLLVTEVKILQYPLFYLKILIIASSLLSASVEHVMLFRLETSVRVMSNCSFFT
jgi:hypothetical protein